jgi:sugar phosphate isomerase/epimerase
MVAYGFAGRELADDLALAHRLGASVLEVLPDWRAWPDPVPLRARVADAGLAVHSAHGCWGGQSIRAPRVDLGAVDPGTWGASVDDLKRCIDWLNAAGGTCLVVHPGGLSDPEEAGARRDALVRGLLALADHARGTPVVACVENMPPGVHPGSRMAEVAAVAAEIDRPEVALALDTGHAQIASTPRAETLAAGRLLRTTHVHDNDGRQDAHLPPGLGSVDWDDWLDALNAVEYHGVIMLECIRHLRQDPGAIDGALLGLLRRLTEVGPPRRFGPFRSEGL